MPFLLLNKEYYITKNVVEQPQEAIVVIKNNKSIYWPGFNFTNILRAAFTRADPKSAKKQLNLTVFFALLGSARVKAACRTLVKLTPVAEAESYKKKKKSNPGDFMFFDGTKIYRLIKVKRPLRKVVRNYWFFVVSDVAKWRRKKLMIQNHVAII